MDYTIGRTDIFSTPEIVSLVFAGAAFLLGLLTLYFTNLKRAEIEVTLLPDRLPTLRSYRWTPRGEEGHWPEDPLLRIPMAAYNIGARTGVLTRIILTQFEELPRPNPIFVLPGKLPLLLEEPNDSFEAGTLRFYTPEIPFRLTVPNYDLAQLKERLANGREIECSITYRYLKGRAKRPWPHYHTATIQDETLKIRISMKDFAAHIIHGG